jgi:2-oxoglutarate dehydrogenase E2 component (dihydrolipoamide succinyltransferase)
LWKALLKKGRYMKINIVVPGMGESISAGTIVEWLKTNGSLVTESEPLFEFETEKATVVVPASATGIVEILVPKETEAAIGQVVGTIDTQDIAAEGAKASPPPPVVSPAAALSPAVRRVVAENNVDPGSISGSGKGGRITKADALAAPKKAPAAPRADTPPVAAVSPVSPVPGVRSTTRVTMTTLRKRTAERLVLARQQSVHVTTYNEIDMSKVMAIRSHHQEAFEKEHGIKLGFMSFFVKACLQGALQPP